MEFDKQLQLNTIADLIGPEIYEWTRQRLLDSDYTSDDKTNLLVGTIYTETLMFAVADIVYKLIGSFNPDDRNYLFFRIVHMSLNPDRDDAAALKELNAEVQLDQRIHQYQVISRQYKTFRQALKTKLGSALNALQRTGYAMQVHAVLPQLEQAIDLLASKSQ